MTGTTNLDLQRANLAFIKRSLSFFASFPLWLGIIKCYKILITANAKAFTANKLYTRAVTGLKKKFFA